MFLKKTFLTVIKYKINIVRKVALLAYPFQLFSHDLIGFEIDSFPGQYLDFYYEWNLKL